MITFNKFAATVGFLVISFVSWIFFRKVSALNKTQNELSRLRAQLAVEKAAKNLKDKATKYNEAFQKFFNLLAKHRDDVNVTVAVAVNRPIVPDSKSASVSASPTLH